MTFSVLLADPPWQFGDKLPGPGRGAEKHYGTLSLAQLRVFPLPPLRFPCLLFLWRVAAMPEEALSVCRAWGFAPKSEIVWVKKTPTGKRHFGMGRYVRAEHETCLIGARGPAHRLIGDRSIRSTFEAATGEHSQKPDEFYDLIERLAPGLPRVELFARRPRAGWSQYGNELPNGAAHP